MQSVSTIPASPADDPFLFRVYAGTRRAELAAWGWDGDEQEKFLRMQFAIQRQSYAMQFPGADHRIVLRDGAPVGRIIVVRTERDILLADIAMLPEYRGAGLGTTVIQTLQAEAAQTGRTLRLHVDRGNPAFRLYERLGFQVTEETVLQYAMEWRGAD